MAEKTPLKFNIIEELRPEDLTDPRAFDEWLRRERAKTFLEAWTAQANHERKLRGNCAWMIFGLATAQTAASFIIIILIGTRFLTIDPIFIRILYPCLITQIYGLFFVMAKYLFNKPLNLNPSDFISAAGEAAAKNPKPGSKST